MQSPYNQGLSCLSPLLPPISISFCSCKTVFLGLYIYTMRYLLLIAVLLGFQAVSAQSAKKLITQDDLWKDNTFRIKSVPGFNAMNDGKRYTQIDKDSSKQRICAYDLATGKMLQTLFDNMQQIPDNGEVVEVDDYVFSKDEQKMLLKTNSKNIYRRSVLNRIFVFDIKSGTIKLMDTGSVLHATFSPDGTKVAYVTNNNLYYKDLATNEVVSVSNDGEWNKIINGNCDWVYEEEFGFTRAFDWSADGGHIAYYRFDESKVPEYTLPKYTGLYPENYTYKYPKAGEVNSIIQIKIYDVKKKTTVNADLGKETDQYIPRIKWANSSNKLCIYRLNRLQNKLELLLADANDGRSDVIYAEENKYYIDINDNITFLPDGNSFIFASEQDGYQHLYRYDWKSKKQTKLTEGNYDIERIVSIDEKNKLVYYTAAENSPMERKLYSVDWNGGKKKLLTPEDGTHAITEIKGNNYFLDRYSSLTTPPVYYLRNAAGKIVRTLEDNKALKDKIAEYDMGKISFTKVSLPSGQDFNGWIITPPNFDAHKKYPVLMYQYSGPGSQEVGDRFPVGNYFWHQMLAQKGYIVFCADGSGTGYRGEEFKKKTYLQMGKYESEDQINIANYLASLPYVDKDRIGIWGWSYGGFMSSTCLFKGNEIFKAAIAVAPVTNWRYYDNIYTERYMRTPKENASGYDDNAPEKMADKLKGKFLLIHGTGDDNVHFQNSIMLTEALIKANKQFELGYYPNKAHGISGGNTRRQLYTKMTDFILSNL